MSKKVRTKLSIEKMKVCTRLGRWRRQSGFTQVEVAGMLGVKLATYMNWEQLRRGPTGPFLSKLDEFISKAEAGGTK